MQDKLKLEKINVIQNSRVKLGDLSKLMSSIKKDGLINPIVIAKELNGIKNVLIAGHRRYYAHQKLGLSEIPVNYTDISSVKDAMILNLAENLQRENTQPYEEGRFFCELVDKYDMNLDELSVRLDITKSYIQSAMTTFRGIPEKYKEKVTYDKNSKTREKGKVPMTVAKAILDVCNEMRLNVKDKDKMIKYCIQHNIKEGKLRLFLSCRAINEDLTFESFMEEMEHIVMVRVNVPVYRNELNDTMEELECGKSRSIMAAIYGDIEPFVKPFQD